MACSQSEPTPADYYQPPTQQVPVTPPQQNPNAEFYLRQAQYYQQLANSELDSANHAMKQANYELEQANQAFADIDFYSAHGFDLSAQLARSEYERRMANYSSYMQDYQSAMERYANYQQLANDYLLKAR
jgi:hypothetical protein